jgi:hypothetical protein
VNIGAAQAHAPGARLELNSGTVNLLTDAGSPAARNLTVVSSTNTFFGAAQHLAALLVNAGKTQVLAGGDRVIVTGLLAIDPSAQLNLNDNDLILDYAGAASPFEQVRQLLQSGFDNGGWNGRGIATAHAGPASSRALGYAEATDVFSTFPATFAGQQVDGTSVLVRFTSYGDADLSGTVNLNDFNRLAANFGTSNRNWVHGDADYNRTVNLADFNRTAAAFGSTVAAANRTGGGPTEDDEPRNPGLEEV